jgi:hypothetical protein
MSRSPPASRAQLRTWVTAALTHPPRRSARLNRPFSRRNLISSDLDVFHVRLNMLDADGLSRLVFLRAIQAPRKLPNITATRNRGEVVYLAQESFCRRGLAIRPGKNVALRIPPPESARPAMFTGRVFSRRDCRICHGSRRNRASNIHPAILARFELSGIECIRAFCAHGSTPLGL